MIRIVLITVAEWLELVVVHQHVPGHVRVGIGPSLASYRYYYVVVGLRVRSSSSRAEAVSRQSGQEAWLSALLLLPAGPHDERMRAFVSVTSSRSLKRTTIHVPPCDKTNERTDGGCDAIPARPTE